MFCFLCVQPSLLFYVLKTNKEMSNSKDITLMMYTPAAFVSALPRSCDDSDYDLHASAEACIADEREAIDARNALHDRLVEADRRVRDATMAREQAVLAKLRYDFSCWIGERMALTRGLSRGCAMSYKHS